MAAAPATRNILVVGATGKQGSSVVRALLTNAALTDKIHILALTRNPTSRSAQALLTLPGAGRIVEPADPDKEMSMGTARLTLVAGEPTKPGAIFTQHPNIDTVVSLTVPPNEEPQAIPLIDLAIEKGATQIIYLSVDRGGDAKSWENPTDVPHFRAKHHVEVHLRDAARNVETYSNGKRHVRWTMFRPTAFMDNYNPGAFAAVMAALVSTLPPDKKLQMVSVRDVGIFVALAVADPEGWDKRALALAGDELTLAETREKFKRITGKELPQAWTLVGRTVRWMVGDVGKMVEFFDREGYGADIEALKKLHPGLQNWEAWLRESSKWELEGSEK